MHDAVNQYYIRTALADEIGIKIPNNAEIIKVKFKRVFDASKYKVIYVENGEKKVLENWIDSENGGPLKVADFERSAYLLQYIKKNKLGEIIGYVDVYTRQVIGGKYRGN